MLGPARSQTPRQAHPFHMRNSGKLHVHRIRFIPREWGPGASRPWSGDWGRRAPVTIHVSDRQPRFLPTRGIVKGERPLDCNPHRRRVRREDGKFLEGTKMTGRNFPTLRFFRPGAQREEKPCGGTNHGRPPVAGVSPVVRSGETSNVRMKRTCDV